MTIERRTLLKAITLQGLGLHSGVPVTVTVNPGERGIRFHLEGEVINAVPSNVTDTSRCTMLGRVRTIEHLMSALAAHEITDADIELSAEELPGLDGSSREYYTALKSVGTTCLGEEEVDDIFTRLYIQADDIKVAVGKGTGHWRFDFDSGDRWPGQMSFDSPDVLSVYEREIAPARTTVFRSEIEMARAAGLGQGLDESSVLILGPDGYDNTPRFDTEPARHKLLDLIGDLALAGIPIRHLNVVATKSGHRRNVEMAALLYDATHQRQRQAN